jgi:hypothetical protein
MVEVLHCPAQKPPDKVQSRYYFSRTKRKPRPPQRKDHGTGQPRQIPHRKHHRNQHPSLRFSGQNPAVPTRCTHRPGQSDYQRFSGHGYQEVFALSR